MFLKKITLHGFKSFADRTEFEFGPGVTVIVGPNGCGKSNVLDALRWVLGEQSARTLRGAKMADVVFAGARTRKPANFAEVTLTFDNAQGKLPSDQAEVVVGRVLYANGESEYRLNGNACRLKDVRDLFLDTGVGVDAYSVIEQGRVDVLLQSSPIERREIFEEAAGISRYKVRRAEAQRKLERSEQNLLRLTDVIDELEKRLRSVKLAAGKARNYLEYDGRLRSLRSAFSLAEYHELRAAADHESRQRAALQDAVGAERAELGRCDADAAELAHTLQQLDTEIHARETEHSEAQRQHSALAERIAAGERRQVELAQTRQRRSEQALGLTQRVVEIEARLVQERGELERLAEAAQAAAQRGEELGAVRAVRLEETHAARRARESEQAAAFEAARHAALVRNEQTNLLQQRQRLGAQRDRLEERQAELEAQRDMLAGRRDELARRADELEQHGAALSVALRAASAHEAALETERGRLGRGLAEQKEARSALRSRLDLLSDLETRLEGVDQGTRSVLAWRDEPERDGGVVGLVADILRIDDPRVDRLQAVLATFEQHVVVRDSYAYLSELARRGDPPGMVSVIALDRLRPLDVHPTWQDAPGVVAWADEWVNCAEEYRPLARALLGCVAIVDVLERALALAASAPAGYAFVTLAGQVVLPGGVITVGASRQTPGLISRKAHIRQLQSDEDELTAAIDQASRALQALQREQADAQLQREARLGEIAETQRRQAELRGERLRVDDQAARLAQERELLGAELGTLGRSLDELDAGQARLAQLVDESDAAQLTSEARLAELDERVRAMEAQLAEIGRSWTEALVAAGRAEERRGSAAQACQELVARAAGLREEQAAAEREARAAAEQIEAAEQELADNHARLTECQALVERLGESVLGLREQRSELRARIEACGASAREIHGRIEALDGRVHACEMALRELEVRQENLVLRVREELALELSELYATYQHREQDWDVVRAEIEELRGKIVRLGHVNLDAIAELEELTPRYENLVGQRSDLNDAIGRLRALIAELDLESRTRFGETFERIRENFQNLFRKVFGGGKADIILENPEDPLECGIEIIARPPGKEPRSISLLSGGEKTMTAVALLLAVFRSRPSPFAVLDEVDAALDESNIERFNNVVQEFLSESQFVVITHNKRTMQYADVLYGVTMEEPGVSKRVSVRFEDRVETPSVA